MYFSNYLVQQGDTLESIAGRLLGDPARAAELAALNRLRWPFLSDDPRDQLGEPLFSSALAVAYDGGYALVLQDYDIASYQASHAVLLTGTGGLAGVTFADTAIVAGWGVPGVLGQVWSSEMTAALTVPQLASLPTGNVLYLGTQPTHQYAVGTIVGIYENPALARTQVLGTGDTLRVPLTADLSNILTSSGSDFASLLGTDLVLDAQGQLLLVGRDLATVAGVPNLAQALAIRATTEQGELAWHADYGDAALQQIGRVRPETNALLHVGIAQCLLGDPRIAAVKSLTITRAGDTVRADAQLMLADNATLLALADLVLQAV